MTVAPQQRAHWHNAYDAQMALWRWYRTKLGQAFLMQGYHDLTKELKMDAKFREQVLDQHQAEGTRLLDLDPIFVSEEMCEVVEAAAESFQPEPLLETDLITPRGFLYYERAFEIPNRFDKMTWIKGISWQRIYNTAEGLPKEEYKELLSKMTSEHRMEPGWIEGIEDELDKDERFLPWGISLTIYTDTEKEEFAYPTHFPPVVPLHLTPWYFNMTFDGNEVDTNGVPTGAAWWWRIVQTTFRLMQQRLAHKGYGRPDRASRREGKKLGIPDEREVVVVRLRREKGETNEPTGEKANYSHRFIRSGHWRNQPYPSEGIHRQIWIHATVVGDPELPLIVRPRRVYQWER